MAERLQVILEMVTGQYKRGAHEAAGATRQVATSAEKAGGAASGLGGKLKKLSRGPLVGLAAGGFAAKQAFDFTVGAAVGFDQKMTESLAIMGDVSDAMRGDMSDAAREVAKTTTFSADQAAESYFFLASAGLDAEQSIAAMPAVARFAQAGMFDMARATDLATDAQSALGLSSDDSAKNLENLTRVTDVFTKANVLANTSVEQIAEAMTNKAGAALRNVNKDVEEGAAVLAAYADQGLKGAGAGEALNIVLRDLQRAALGNEEAFERAGVAVFDSSGNMRNIAEIVADLEERFDGMSDAQKRAELTTLGFQDKSSANLLTLLGTSEAIREYESELRSAGGVTEEIADKQLESAAAQWDLFKSELQDVGLEVGENLLPTLMELLPVLKEGAEGVGDTVANLAPLLQILGPIAGGFGQVTSALNGTNENLGVFNKGTQFLGDFLKGPAGFGLRAWESGVDVWNHFTGAAENAGRASGSSAGEIEVMGAAASDAAPEVSELSGAAGDLADSTDRAAQKQRELVSVMLEALDPAARAAGALDRMRDAAENLNSVQADSESTAEDVAQAQLDYAQAILEAQSALDQFDASGPEGSIDALSTALGISREEARKLLEDLNLLDGKEVTSVIHITTRRTDVASGRGTDRTAVSGRQHGGDVGPGQVFAVGEGNRAEMMLIPGDQGRVWSHTDTRALIAAANSALSSPAATSHVTNIGITQHWPQGERVENATRRGLAEASFLRAS